jgi:hypothetical protein
MSLAIALPAEAAISDLIAKLRGTLAEPPIGKGAVVLSPLQALASITTAASLIKRRR